MDAAPRAVKEYLDTLDEAAFGAATPVQPKFTSFSDPASQWTTARKIRIVLDGLSMIEEHRDARVSTNLPRELKATFPGLLSQAKDYLPDLALLVLKNRSTILANVPTVPTRPENSF